MTVTEKIEGFGVRAAKAFGFNARTTKEIEEGAYVAWARERGCFGNKAYGAAVGRNLAAIRVAG